MPRKLLVLLLFLISTQIAVAQNATQPKKADEPEKLRKQAVEFLRETLVDVNGMRSLENRISFGAEMASLMWFHDDKEARSMYLGVIGDFKQLVFEYDSRMNALGPTEDDDMGYAGPFSGDMTDSARLRRQFTVAMGVRKQIALSLAEHDPDLALSFYYDSLQAVTNPTFRKQFAAADSYFEFQLMGEVAESNAAKAAEFGRKSLDKGVNYQHIELLKKIYGKDADRGADFASELLSKINSETSKKTDLDVISSLLRFGTETFEKSKKEGGKKPVYDESKLRDLADTFGQMILDRKSLATDGDDAGGAEYADQIEKYAPSRAIQIRAKFRSKVISSNSRYAANVISTAANSMAVASNSAPSAAAQKRAMTEAAEKKLIEDVQKFGKTELPKEEREKVVAELRKIISQSNGAEKKIPALSMLAAQVARAGDKDLAGEIMKDAQNLVNPQPKNYKDLMLTLMLVSGFAEVDPEKAFPILDDSILRINDTIGAALKIAEFVDLNGEIIDDGEIQVGAFGGSMIREMTRSLGSGDDVIHKLAVADFAKMKATTNQFDRSELRILAKMMVIRTLLNNKKEAVADVETVKAMLDK